MIASWGVDTVRLPLNQDCWLGTRSAPVSDDFVERTPLGYRGAVDRFVRALNAEGLVVVLDLHSRKRIGSAGFGSTAMPDSESLAFWRSVAAQYSASPSVLFDAFSAPHSRDDVRGAPVFELGWRCWSQGGCEVPVEDDRTQTKPGRATYEALGMADLVAAIRRAGAEQPILLSGLDGANDLRAWADSVPDDDQLVAAFHAYDTAACGPACWERVLAPLADRVPVLTTELGAEDPTDGWVADYLRFAQEHDIGSLLWVWAELPADPMALVSDLDGTPTPWGELAREWWSQGLPEAG
ncbi:glycoside hydrolase family 5 protein [Nocardioides marinus]